MARRPAFVELGGRRVAWSEVTAARRAALEAANAPDQPLLFGDLHRDVRPAEERTAAGRYAQPGLFDR